MENAIFYAKILLFGEYGIIENAKGLAVPYKAYQGQFQFSSLEQEFEKKSNQSLKKYLDFLKKMPLSERFRLNLSLFEQEIERGLFFNSNIPYGYGVGSSGALVAAIFNRYTNENAEQFSQEKLKALKPFLGAMESFFHGKSSGIDPLICAVKTPILIENKEHITKVNLPKNQEKEPFFLLDSGQVGETEPMVQIFFEKMKNEVFRKSFKEEFISYNDACIHHFLREEKEEFFANLKLLSAWTFEHFRPMIPESILPIWKKGLESDAYYLKLCGSGGGGYVLGFSRDMIETEKTLKNITQNWVR